MWFIRKSVKLACTHRLPGIHGPAGKWHTHDFIVTACVAGDSLNGHVVISYDDLEDQLETVVGPIRDSVLNLVPGLENPSCEVIAQWVYNRMFQNNPRLHSVKVEESSTASAEYSP